MGEPEDLIIDGAYLASRLARDVWRRYAPAPVATPESARQLARRHSRFARAKAAALENRNTQQESESHG